MYTCVVVIVCLPDSYLLRLTTVALGFSTSTPSEEGLNIDGGDGSVFLHRPGRPPPLFTSVTTTFSQHEEQIKNRSEGNQPQANYLNLSQASPRSRALPVPPSSTILFGQSFGTMHC
jgi:hypothetical protein